MASEHTTTKMETSTKANGEMVRLLINLLQPAILDMLYFSRDY